MPRSRPRWRCRPSSHGCAGLAAAGFWLPGSRDERRAVALDFQGVLPMDLSTGGLPRRPVPARHLDGRSRRQGLPQHPWIQRCHGARGGRRGLMRPPVAGRLASTTCLARHRPRGDGVPGVVHDAADRERGRAASRRSGVASIYLPGGVPLHPASGCVIPALADTLRALRDTGRRRSTAARSRAACRRSSGRRQPDRGRRPRPLPGGRGCRAHRDALPGGHALHARTTKRRCAAARHARASDEGHAHAPRETHTRNLGRLCRSPRGCVAGASHAERHAGRGRRLDIRACRGGCRRQHGRDHLHDPRPLRGGRHSPEPRDRR